MKLRLFWRLFSAFMLVTLATVAMFLAMLSLTLQRERQETFENEVRMQAYEVADYMAHLDQISFVRENTTMQYIIRRKLANVHKLYNADIWIVSYNSGIVQYIDSSWNTAGELPQPDDAVLEQLAQIQQGKEIRVQGLFSQLGDKIVTIGVPWRYSDGQVVGAVLLHIGTEKLRVSILNVFRQGLVLPATAAALLLGTLMSWFLARSQVRPIRQINSAVRDFAKGKFDRRVELDCGGELQELGESFNKMAGELAQLEESRRSFVANVSHELRSPMTSIQGYVQGMLDGTISQEEQPRYLRVVLDETRRLTDLVRDLLDLSRIESGNFPLEIADFDINELARRILINYERRIDEKDIEVEVDFDADYRYVRADASRISQVLSNLIDNAIKFLPERGGRLKISVAREGRGVRVAVEDNGSGISREDLPHVFERFYKADKAHTSGMGTGLGLSIVKRILEQHGTDIAVRSGDGGTAFEFVLESGEAPVRERAASAEAEPGIVQEDETQRNAPEGK